MNLMTKYELGDFVYSVLDPTKKMQVIRIDIFLDGGYQYNCTWMGEDGVRAGNFFEGELEDK